LSAVDDRRSARLRRIEEGVERSIRELAESGELRGLPGEGKPLPDDDPRSDAGWAARHVVKQAKVVPAWAELRREIDERRARIKRRLIAHREWLHDRTRFIGELPADRILEATHATATRDLKVRAELEQAVSELNALIRRYDLLVVPAMQLPLVTLERLGSEPA
jgi:Asp-tRNA(Asn)/Glu-tRNA(Gln) amidotransferase A subunit family amidase